MKSIKHIIPGLILIALLSIFVGVILPGVLMYENHIFSKTDVINRLDSTTKLKYQTNELERQRIENRRIQLYKRISDTNQNISSNEINATYLALDNLKRLKEEHDTIKIMPYYPNNKSLLIWPLLYFGLYAILFFNRDITKTEISKIYYFSIFILVYFFWRWAAWFRNTSLGDIDRVVYAVNNLDISKLGFFLQEFLSLISLLLLSFIFCKWIIHSETLKSNYDREINIDLGTLFKVVTDLRSRYQQCQISSIFLTIAFGYYTYYFWAIINQSHDMRYLPQAIIIHFVWGLSWYVISLPLIITNKYHIYLKDFFTNPLNKSSIVIEDVETFTQIFNADPISAQNKLITALLSGFTFLFPLIKTFI